MSDASERFVLHEEDGLFGVFDRVGPQIFFADSRDQAVREVERANEIVRLHPTTISMRHLREMDAAWRRANGLPPLPEPEGRTVVVTAEVPRPALPASGDTLAPSAPAPSVAAVLDTAVRVGERDLVRRRVEEAREVLKRTRGLGRELTRTWAASETSIGRMRTALRELYGAHASEAERELRDTLRSVDPAPGASAYTAAAARHLSRTAAPTPATAAAREIVGASAPAVAAWDRAADAAAAATGMQVRSGGGDRARYSVLVSALLRLREADERTLAAARAEYAAAATGPGPRTLREQWRALTSADRAAVLQVLPEVPELVRPRRARGRAGPSRGPGGLGR